MEVRASATIELTGLLADDDVYVVADDGADAAILAVADQLSTSNFFNGDDVIALLKDRVVVDVFGQIGVDPGSAWEVVRRSRWTTPCGASRRSSPATPMVVTVSTQRMNGTARETICSATSARISLNGKRSPNPPSSLPLAIGLAGMGFAERN